jgi:hypothetical protein
MTIVLAHLGGAHWLNYVLMAVPLLVVSGMLLASSMSERRERRAAEGDGAK